MTFNFNFNDDIQNVKLIIEKINTSIDIEVILDESSKIYNFYYKYYNANREIYIYNQTNVERTNLSFDIEEIACYEQIVVLFTVLINHKIKNELIDKLGKEYFYFMQNVIKTTKPEITQHFKKNFEYIDKYYKLLYDKNSKEIYYSDLFNSIVLNRNKMAEISYFKNFHSYESAVNFRNKIEYKSINNLNILITDRIVPLYKNLYNYVKSNKKEDKNNIDFINTITDKLSQLNPELNLFIISLIEEDKIFFNERMNQKISFYNKELSSFIFANKNPSYYGMKSFLHEMGHAFQFKKLYNNKNHFIEFSKPKSFLAETQAGCSEYLLYNSLDLIFENETFVKIQLLTYSLKQIIESSIIEQFEYEVYVNNKKNYSEIWNKLIPSQLKDKKYLKNWYNYFLIFTNPLDYYSYTISSIFSLHFLMQLKENQKESIKNYNDLLKLGKLDSINEMEKCLKVENILGSKSIEKIVLFIENEFELLKDRKNSNEG